MPSSGRCVPILSCAACSKSDNAASIFLSVQGLTQQRISEQLGISRLCVNRWVGRFGGVERSRRARAQAVAAAGRGAASAGAGVTPPPHLGRWSCRTMARDPATGSAFVRHQANAPSGGQVSDIELGGQVNAEPARGRHIGLVGGQMDFIRAPTAPRRGPLWRRRDFVLGVDHRARCRLILEDTWLAHY